ncbi:MAG: hypothetical protein FWG73_05305 [Planctomycetaceae bacterium]|nr:hypothetical protein [Planctomycetaceae bacterium]
MYRIVCFVSVTFFCCLTVFEPALAQRADRLSMLPEVYRESGIHRAEEISRFAGDREIAFKDGIDISGKIFYGIHQDSGMSDVGEFVKNVNFSRSRLYNVSFRDYVFIDSDFSETVFYNVEMSRTDESIIVGNDFHGAVIRKYNNFQDAWINNSFIPLTADQLLSTASYKAKNLVGWRTGATNPYAMLTTQKIDFSGFDLRYAHFSGFVASDYSDAIIEGTTFDFDSHFSIEQLLATKDFKKGIIKGVTFRGSWPEHVIDFSNMVFIDCRFEQFRGIGSDPGSAKIDLTNSVILNSSFPGLTLENIQSTWNYKHGRMEGIRLPEHIQEALDAEKGR